MLDLKRIVCTTDFSAGSHYPLAYALDLARRTGAELHLFYAYVQRRVFYPDELRDRLVGMLPEKPAGVKMRYHVDVGSAAAPCILEYADRARADLIVLGTRCSRANADSLLGDVTRKVLYHARSPVLTVDSGHVPPGADLGVRSILVPVDCSGSSSPVVRQAADLGAIYGARLDLLHVIAEPEYPNFYPRAGSTLHAEAPDLELRAVDALKRLLGDTEHPEVAATFAVRTGSPAEQILEEAEKQESGMLFMATHCCMGQAFLPASNFTETVARHARSPVFTVKTEASGGRLHREMAHMTPAESS